MMRTQSTTFDGIASELTTEAYLGDKAWVIVVIKVELGLLEDF